MHILCMQIGLMDYYFALNENLHVGNVTKSCCFFIKSENGFSYTFLHTNCLKNDIFVNEFIL